MLVSSAHEKVASDWSLTNAKVGVGVLDKLGGALAKVVSGAATVTTVVATLVAGSVAATLVATTILLIVVPTSELLRT